MGRTHITRRRTMALLLGAAVVLGLMTGGPSVQAAAPQVHFTAAGDYNAIAATDTVLNGIKTAAPDLNLALGDLAYGSNAAAGEQGWCDYVTSHVGAGFPFELISGNHESDGTLNGNINDFSSCLPNQLPGVVGTYGRQWYVDYPKGTPTVRFIMISPSLTFPDSTWSYAAGAPRYQWTANAIDGARAAGVPWVVVGMHKPCLSMGVYNCDVGTDLMNLLVSKKVDLVLGGHEHMYQRTKQLALGASCPAVTTGTVNAACIKDSDDALDRGAGTVFITAGTGGTALRDVTTNDTEAAYFRTWSGLNVSPSYGFLDVTADGDSLTAKFTATSGTYTDSFTIRPTTTPPANQTPTARIAAPACTGLSCTFDGSTSSDPDGTIASYAWDFGDGTTGTGATPAHTYASANTYGVVLTVTDDKGGTGSVTRQVPVSTTPPPNQTPTARIAAPACTGLSCTFDGSTSSDPDGTIASYAWDFGDGTTGTGATPAHTYASANTYGVVLTVTDDKGGTGSVTRQVPVSTAPTSTTLASDTFTRTVTGGFGTADVGGAWSVSGSSTNVSVSGSEGKLVMRAAGGGQLAYLAGTSTTTSSDVTMTLAVDKTGTGSGIYVSALPRRIPGAGDYRAKLRFQSTQTVQVSLDRANATGTDTNIATPMLVPGGTYTPGDKLQVRVQAFGTSPTQLRAKVWRLGTTEPTSWLVSGSDSTAGLQVAGGFGVHTYLSSGATNAPITLSVDDLMAVTPAP